MVSLNINFKKKDLWLLSAIVVFLIGVGFVVAYGGNNPSVMGHSAGEISGINSFVPSNYTGQESVTFPNGMILKMGTASNLNSNGDNIINFPVAFPSATVSVIAIDSIDGGGYGEKFRIKKSDIEKDHFHCNTYLSGTSEINWQAWGY